MDNNIKELTKRIIDLRDVRDWKQFHNPKDVALSSVRLANSLQVLLDNNSTSFVKICLNKR